VGRRGALHLTEVERAGRAGVVDVAWWDTVVRRVGSGV
jgi:hypothetical protein